MKAADILEALGFELVGEDPTARPNITWLHQKTVRQIQITLPPDACDLDVLHAIYDAGRRDQQAHIKRRVDAANRSLSTLEPMILLPSEI